MKKLLISRTDYGKKQTLGKMYVLNQNDGIEYSCDTLELAWKNNEFQISCIPEGIYKVKKRWSRKFKHHFHITDVQGRTYILIHSGNFYTDILGCILVGDDLAEINGDGILDVVNSRDTLKILLDMMPDEFNLEIKG